MWVGGEHRGAASLKFAHAGRGCTYIVVDPRIVAVLGCPVFEASIIGRLNQVGTAHTGAHAPFSAQAGLTYKLLRA